MARTDIVKVSGVSSRQRERWIAASQGEGSLSAWLRAVANAAAANHGVGTTGAATERIEAALREVRRELNGTQVYNNLNQLIRTLHLDRKVGLPSHVSAADADVMEAVHAVAAIKDRIQKTLDDLRMLRR